MNRLMNDSPASHRGDLLIKKAFRWWGGLSSLPKVDKWVIVVFILGLVIRLLLINWNTAEYSDSIYYMLQVLDGSWPPLYPASIRLLNFIFNDLEFTAKLLSILAGALSVFPLYLIGKQVYNQKAGLYAVLLYSVSPLALQWSIRIKPDAIFGLFFLLAIYFAIRLYHSQQRKDLIWFTFMAGLSTLAKVYGVLLLPLLILLYVLYLRKNSLKQLALSLVWVGAIPWFLLLAWLLQYEACIPLYASQAFVGCEKGLIALGSFLGVNLIFHVEAFVWAATVPILLCACFGVYQNLHSSGNKTDIRNFWLGVCIYLLIAWFATLSTYSVWGHLDTRHYYGVMPLIVLLAGYGIYSIGYHAGKRWLLLALLVGCILFNSVFSAAALYYQRDAFGDVKRAAVYAHSELQGETIFTDEGPKTSFWAHCPCRSYLHKEEIQPGQYVILHSFYTDIDREESYLASRFETEIIYETTSSIRPLLTDLLPKIEDVLSPEWILQRFKTQHFRSVVIKLTAKSEQK